MTENKGIQIIITAVMASYEEHCEEEWERKIVCADGKRKCGEKWKAKRKKKLKFKKFL
jgi:hypothetical protein